MKNTAVILAIVLLLFCAPCAFAAAPIDALCAAVENDDFDAVDTTLVSYPDMINGICSGGMAPLHCAVSKKMAEYLISKGADVNLRAFTKNTPLHCAAANGYVEVAKVLLKNGASPSAIGMTGQSPLHLAAKKGSVEMIKLLVSNGAAINQKDDHGHTPLDVAKQNDRDEAASALQSLGGR